MKKWLSWLGVGFLGVLLVLALLPQIIGSRWVYRPLLERFAKQDFRLTVDSISLSWFRPAELRGISLKQLEGPALISIDQVKTNRGILGFILHGRDVGELEVIHPVVDIEFLEKGSNVGRLLAALADPNADEKSKKQPPPINIAVAVRDLEGIVHQKGIEKPLVVIPPFDVDLAYQAMDGEARLEVEPATILDHVAVTPELVQFGLKFVVPVLAQASWVDGTVSLETGAILVPLATWKQSTGTAVLQMHQVRCGVTQPAVKTVIDLLSRAFKREPHYEFALMEESIIDVMLADQKVTHDGLKLGVPKVDERLQIASSGSVSIADGSLDLSFEVPLPVEYVARRDAVRGLGIPTVQLPVKGTLKEPKFEWQELRKDTGDVLALIKDALLDEAPKTAAAVGVLSGLASGQNDQTLQMAAQGAAKALQALRDRRAEREKEKQAEASEEPQEEKPATERRRPLRDLFKRKPE